MDELRLELIALMDEALPAHDLALCFSYAVPDKGFETCETYDEIWKLIKELGYAEC